MRVAKRSISELYFTIPAFGLALSTVNMFITGRTPDSIEESIGDAYLIVFLIMMLAGAVVVLTSFFRRGTPFSLSIEIAGLMCLSLSTIIYGVTIIANGEFLISIGATLSICFGIGCLMRMSELRKLIRDNEEQARLCRKHQLDADELLARSEDEGRTT